MMILSLFQHVVGIRRASESVTLNNASDYRANGPLSDGLTGYWANGLGLAFTVRVSGLIAR